MSRTNMDPFRRPLAFRCDQRWQELAPSPRGRHCAVCDTEVIDVSRLTRRQARRATTGGACVRRRFDATGAPVFRAEPVRAGGLVVAAALLGGCAGSPTPTASPAHTSAIEAPPSVQPPEPASGVAVAELADLAELEDALRAWRAEDGPTPEQIALTEAKRRRTTSPTAPALIHPAPWPTLPHATPRPIELEEMGMYDPGW